MTKSVHWKNVVITLAGWHNFFFSTNHVWSTFKILRVISKYSLHITLWQILKDIVKNYMKLLDPQKYLKMSEYIVNSPYAIIAAVFCNCKTWCPYENMQNDAQW